MTAIKTSILALLLVGLVACGAEQTAPVAADEPAATTDESAAETAPENQPAAAEEEQLAAVEESDGSYDADAVAKEGSLRLAQNTVEAAPQRFVEGQHYDRFRPTKMTVTGGEKVEVVEVFWYGCNHCYNLEPVLQRWSADLPENVEFVKIPAVWNPVLETHAQVFFTIEALAGAGELENKNAVHMAFFDEIHVNRQRMSSEKSIIDFLGNFGVDRDTFESAWNSFEVNTKLRQAKTLNRAYEIGSVPTMVVNGKYVTDESRAGSKTQLLAVIDELIASER
ncbi:MAG: thiol:disulfide interchange protein DsbA/DsbL [Pseudomonadota bacterium]